MLSTNRIDFVVIVLLLSASTVRAEPWLYVSLLQEQKIVGFRRDVESGRLTRVGETRCPAEPAFLAASPEGRTLFVSLRSTGELASYGIDSDTGELQVLSVVKGGEDPAFLRTDNTGKFLLTAYYAANKVTVHHVLSGGVLGEVPVQTVLTAERAHGIGVTSDNRTVLVPHTGANRIYSFHFNQQTGLLKPSQPAFAVTPTTHEPRHVMLHPSDNWAYTSDEKGDSISVYSLKDGRLSRLQTERTIPEDFDGDQNSTARCEITPDGRFVYVANRGHNSLAAFSIDQRTGRVTALGQTPTEPTPRSFTIDRTGQFLYVAGQASGRIAVHQIQQDGTLKNMAVVDSGPVSWAVVAVDPK